jgi:hypothetical protein
MLQQELLSRVIRCLDDLGIDSMLTGCYASSIQGEPRSTHDIDLVVSLTSDDADNFVEAFTDPEFYLSPSAMREAIERRGMFNVIHMESGYNVDFWVLKDLPFDTLRFARKRPVTAWDIVLKVSTPEDTILAKLRWAREGCDLRMMAIPEHSV